MRLTEFRPEFVDEILEPLEPGVLYISEKFGFAISLCPCGCGQKIVADLKPHWGAGWDYKRDGDKVTLSPSIATNEKCGSHYFIRENRVEWCG